MGANDHPAKGEKGISKLDTGLRTGVSNLWALLGGKYASRLVRISVRRKGAAEYSGSVSVIGAGDGLEYVAFGNGHDYLTCFMAINASVTANKWVLSRPFGSVSKGLLGVLEAPDSEGGGETP